MSLGNELHRQANNSILNRNDRNLINTRKCEWCCAVALQSPAKRRSSDPGIQGIQLSSDHPISPFRSSAVTKRDMGMWLCGKLGRSLRTSFTYIEVGSDHNPIPIPSGSALGLWVFILKTENSRFNLSNKPRQSPWTAVILRSHQKTAQRVDPCP